MEVQSRMFPEEGYSTPRAPQSLNREAYLPDKLTYQDIRWWPVLLTVAYCQCLQHWAEKRNLPENPDFCPLAESVRELRQAIHEFVNITWEDVMKGLKMEEPEGGHWPSPMTIFSWVLGPLANRQEAEESSARPRDRAIECTPPTLRLEQEDQFVLVIASLMSWLTIGPGSDNVRRGRNLLWSHRRPAIFLPCHPAPLIGRGAASTDPNATTTGPIIEDITGQEWKKQLKLTAGQTNYHPSLHDWTFPKLAAGQMSYHPSLHDWTVPISAAGQTTNCMNIPLVIFMFYSHPVLERNFTVLWCLPTYVCIRVVFVPQVGWGRVDSLC